MSSRLPGLDGLRGLAALCVLTFHVWLYRDGVPARVVPGDAVSGALSSLRIALVFFFVLSGFLLARDLRRWLDGGVRAASLRRYAGRRARRILPAYWVALLGTLLLVWGGTTEQGIRLPPAERLWAFPVLAQNYFSDSVMTLNPVTWTLAIEVAFYVLLPLLALLLVLIRGRHLLWAAALLIGVSLAANVGAQIQEWDLPARKTLVPFLGYFGVGMAVAWLADRRREPLGGPATVALALGGVAVVAAWSAWQLSVENPGDHFWLGVLQHVPSSFGFGALVWAGAQGGGAAARAMAARPLVSLGLVSYGFYLWHLPILLGLNRLGDWPAGLLWLATMALSLPVAIASWRLIERPALEAPATLPRPWTSSRPSSSASSRG